MMDKSTVEVAQVIYLVEEVPHWEAPTEQYLFLDLAAALDKFWDLVANQGQSTSIHLRAAAPGKNIQGSESQHLKHSCWDSRAASARMVK